MRSGVRSSRAVWRHLEVPRGCGGDPRYPLASKKRFLCRCRAAPLWRIPAVASLPPPCPASSVSTETWRELACALTRKYVASARPRAHPPIAHSLAFSVNCTRGGGHLHRRDTARTEGVGMVLIRQSFASSKKKWAFEIFSVGFCAGGGGPLSNERTVYHLGTVHVFACRGRAGVSPNIFLPRRRI